MAALDVTSRAAAQAPSSGVAPVVPTIFTADGELDPVGNRRTLDYLIDASVDAICILANYSEQFSLSDGERDELLHSSIEHVAGRLPVIVTTSHFATRIAVERARRAEAAGASMVMVMPPYHGATLRADPARIDEHLGSISSAIGIPMMIQDAPLSGMSFSAEHLARLAREYASITHVKVETVGTADKLRELVALSGEGLRGPWDGEESVTLLADLDAGANGTMPSSSIPDVLGRVVRHHASGDRDAAERLYEQHLPLIHYENRQCGLRAAKVLLHAGGVIDSPATRHPIPPLPDAHREALLRLARRRDALILRWAR